MVSENENTHTHPHARHPFSPNPVLFFFSFPNRVQLPAKEVGSIYAMVGQSLTLFNPSSPTDIVCRHIKADRASWIFTEGNLICKVFFFSFFVAPSAQLPKQSWQCAYQDLSVKILKLDLYVWKVPRCYTYILGCDDISKISPTADTVQTDPGSAHPIFPFPLLSSIPLTPASEPPPDEHPFLDYPKPSAPNGRLFTEATDA